MIRLARAASAALVLSSAALPHCVAAQADSSAKKTFFVPMDALWFGTFALGSFALSAKDPQIAQYFQQPRWQDDNGARRIAEAFTRVQETTLTLGGLATYGIARLVKARSVADVALHATEAVVLGSLTSQVIRGPLGRARPDAADPQFENQYDFAWFKGFTSFDHRAYPSIHASSSFAAGTVILMETHRRVPGATWYVAPIAAAIAIGPAYSRLYLGRHWASDILMGGFLGTFYGMRVVNYNHDHPDNKFDRLFLGPAVSSGLQVMPQPGGFSFSYSRQF